MAKEIAGQSINREELEWGTRLTLRPFPDPQYNGNMEITAEVTSPKPGRGAEIKVRFSGVPVQTPLRATDVVVWQAGLSAVMEEARKTGLDMKNGKKPTKRKKS